MIKVNTLVFLFAFAISLVVAANFKNSKGASLNVVKNKSNAVVLPQQEIAKDPVLCARVKIGNEDILRIRYFIFDPANERFFTKPVKRVQGGAVATFITNEGVYTIIAMPHTFGIIVKAGNATLTFYDNNLDGVIDTASNDVTLMYYDRVDKCGLKYGVQAQFLYDLHRNNIQKFLHIKGNPV